MQLLLLTDVRKLGHIGDIVEVKAGYARNYLIPQRLAAEPTEENIRSIEDAKRAAAAERAKRVKEFEALAQKVADASVTIEAMANPEGTLYGSVGATEIAEALNGLGHPVLAEHVVLDAPIRTLDNRTVKIEFTDEITTEIKLWVVRAGADENEQHADEAETDDDRDDDYDDGDD